MNNDPNAERAAIAPPFRFQGPWDHSLALARSVGDVVSRQRRHIDQIAVGGAEGGDLHGL
jgi:hypothetical protein